MRVSFCFFLPLFLLTLARAAEQEDIGCQALEFKHTFTLENYSRSLLIIAGTSTSPDCKVIGFTEQPIAPSSSGVINFECKLSQSYDGRSFVKSLRVQAKKIKPQAGISDQVVHSFIVTGKASKNCPAARTSLPPNHPKEQATLMEKDCKSFRLDESGMPLSQVAVRDQKQVGSCYSAAATTLFDYLRALEGRPPRDAASTLAAAVDYKKYVEHTYDDHEARKRPEVLDGGFADETLQLLINDGACTNEVVRRNLGLNNLTEDQFNELYSVFVLSLDEFQRQILDADMKRCLKAFDRSIRMRAQTADLPCSSINQFASLASTKIAERADLACYNTLALVSDGLKVGCSEAERVRLKDKWKVKYVTEDLQSSLEKRFFKNPHPHPVAVGTAGCIFTDRPAKYPGHKKFLDSEVCREGGAHETVLIGQTWNQKAQRCEVILRNSWGNLDCKYYPGWDCDPKHGTVNIDKGLFEASLTHLGSIEKDLP